MNLHQSMMVTNCDFFDVKSLILQPAVGVSEKGRNLIHYLTERNTHVFVRLAISSGPCPSLIEHSLMKPAKIWLDERVFPFQHTWIERLSVRVKNIRTFKLIQLTFRREARS